MSAAAIDVEVARQLAGRPAPEVTEIDEADEGRAAGLFLAMDTQWMWASSGTVAGHGGFGQRTGLRYEALPIVATAHDLVLDQALLADVKTMEQEALKTFAEARAR
ncbi:hypothetical protein [Polymorphobacter sp.]|uniref:hypothetical protein n=1 Tax=Polymorphobacter sp. TaxID=1909290 RepID=UPI003F72A9CB